MLRDEFRHSDRLVVPTRDAMRARVGRVRRRRMTVAGAGLFGVVATVSVVVASVVAGGVPRTMFGSTGAGKIYQAEVINAIFTDAQHGNVVQQLCTMDNPGSVPDGAPT